MSLVPNFIGNISSLQFGKHLQNAVNDVDITDKTFSDILDRKLTGMDNSMNTQGVNILDFYNKKVDNIQFDNNIIQSQTGDRTTSEVLTFTKSLFDSSNLLSERGSVYDFSRKSATNFYNKYSKNIAMNLGEFVSDALKTSK